MTQQLAKRLDDCAGIIGSASKLKKETRSKLLSESAVYAALLSDIIEGRAHAEGEPARVLTSSIEDFCTMIETELKPTTEG
jgi:hypothetical protein